MQVITSNKDTRADTNQQAQGSRRAGNHFQQAPTTMTHQPAGTRRHEPAGTRRHEPARHKDTRTSRHKVQSMQVITSNKDTRADTNQQAQGSRHAGNHFQQRHTSRHQPARHEVQGMQVTTSNKDTRADTNQQAQGSKYAGNHFQQARTTRTHKAHQSAGTSFAGPEKVTSKAQSKHQPAGTRRHQPARHKVQGVQVTTSNKHEPQGDTNQQAQGSRYAGNHFQQAPTTMTHQPAGTRRHEPAGTRFKVCR